MTAAAGVVPEAEGPSAASGGGVPAEELLARALEVIDRQSARIDELARENAELRELAGEQAARLAEANETIAVLQRMVFGRKSEKDRPESPDGENGDDSAGDGGGEPSQCHGL